MEAVMLATKLYIYVFTFLLIKLVTQGQLFQQLVKSVANTYLARFFAFKNHNARAVMLVARLAVSIFAFPFMKIIT